MSAKTLKLTYSATGAEFEIPLHNLDATTAPGVGDDDVDGYAPGSQWINTTTDDVYVCTDNTTGAAVWVGPLDAGAVTEAFKTISVSGQSDVVADSATDTLTLAAGTGITITTDAGTDTVTITGTGGTVTESFKTISVSGQSDVVADSATDTLTLAAGSNVTITTNAGTDTITISSNQTDVTGNAGTVTVADAGGDTTTWPLLGTSQTGNLSPATDAGLTYNATTNALTATTFTGALSGNADTATTATNVTVANEGADTTCFPAFFTAATGNLPPKTNSSLKYDSAANTLEATTFKGTATSAVNIIVEDETSDTTCFPLFGTSATGTMHPKSNAGLTYNSSTNNLGCTTFTGAFSGNASTATALQTARTINGVSFNGTADITISASNASTVTVANEAADATCFPLFATAATGDLGPKTNAGLAYNSSTNNLTCTTFTGALAGTATYADSANLVVNGSDTTCFLIFSANSSGTSNFLVNSSLAYNASTNALTATTFVGALSGNASTATSAATLTTARAIYGNNFDGSAALTQVIASTYGGTGNGFTKFTGPTTSEKTFTLPNASATILTSNAAVTTGQGGTGADLSATGPGVLRQTAAGANVTVGQALDYIVLRDEKTSGTGGGTFTSGAWQTRTLNTESVDTGSHCTLSSNQFTLSAGTYRIQASAPACQVAVHQARLQNVTDGTTTIVGTSEFNTNGAQYAQTRSVVSGRFTIATSKTFELQHRCSTTRSTYGFGFGATLTTEVYSVVELWREAG